MAIYKKVGFDVDEELWKQVKHFCSARDIIIKNFMNAAIKSEINKAENQKIITQKNDKEL